MAVKPTEDTISVNGSRVHYLRWGRRGGRPLVLVHGTSAHARWWSHLAPLFPDADVVVPDLPGHGESDWTETYSLESLANAVAAVIGTAGFAAPPTLIGHSLGGAVTVVCASRHPSLASGLVVVDTSLTGVPPEIALIATRAPKLYPATESAGRRFKLMPPQPHVHPFIVEAVGEASAKRDGDTWSWRFDPRVFSFDAIDHLEDHIRAVRCRSAVFCGEHSHIMPPANADRFVSLLGNAIRVDIPDAHHHLILDQPLAFVAATRTLLATWKD